MTVPDLNATRPLRTRIENLLRDTVPGRDPEFPYAAQFTPVQIDLLRKMLPAEPARAAVLVPLVDMIKNGEIALIVNTVEEKRAAIVDSRSIRTSALGAKVTLFTTIEGGRAACAGMRHDGLETYSLQSLHAELDA